MYKWVETVNGKWKHPMSYTGSIRALYFLGGATHFFQCHTDVDLPT